MKQFYKENKKLVNIFIMLYLTTFAFMATSAILLSNMIYGTIK